MKKNLSRSLMLTAVALTLGVAAYGQQSLTASVPFAFRTNGENHAAGDYAVILNNSAASQLVEKATGKAVYLGAGVPEGGGSSRESQARLVFRCTDDGGCSLSQVWIGDGRGFSYSAPKAKSSQVASIRVVYFGEAVNR